MIQTHQPMLVRSLLDCELLMLHMVAYSLLEIVGQDHLIYDTSHSCTTSWFGILNVPASCFLLPVEFNGSLNMGLIIWCISLLSCSGIRFYWKLSCHWWFLYKVCPSKPVMSLYQSYWFPGTVMRRNPLFNLDRQNKLPIWKVVPWFSLLLFC